MSESGFYWGDEEGRRGRKTKTTPVPDPKSDPFAALRCLVVDDDRFSRLAVGRMLRKLGCRIVDTAVDGMMALETSSRAPRSFDVIISDYDMPSMNGLDLLKQIRLGAIGINRDVLFFMLTNHSDRPIVGAAFALDIDCFILKPASVPELARRLRRVLDAKRAIQPPRLYANVNTAIGWAGGKPPPPGVTVVDTHAGHVRAADMRSPEEIDASSLVSKYLTLLDIPIGSVLMQDIYTSQGELLVPSGQVLTRQLLDRLQDLEDLGFPIEKLEVGFQRENDTR